MWGLRSLKTGEVVTIVLNERECDVGRIYGGITILDDASISLCHAVLKLVHSEDNLGKLDCPSTLTVKDTGSKYGTFVNGIQLATGSTKTLSTNDVIKFGQMDSSYSVFHKDLVVSISCLGENELDELKRVICKLGGHTIREWHSSCTHLVMPSVRVTSKALCCLVSLKPLVTLQFFHALLISIVSKVPVKDLPKEKDFVPCMSETLIDRQRASFNIMPARQNLFKNKKFIFLERDTYEKYHLPIILGGGTAIIAERGNPPFFTASCCIEPGTCVIQPVCNNLDTRGFFFAIFEGIAGILRRNKKRFIPDNEIVLAIVHCSTGIFCNPNFIESVPMLESKDKTVPSQSFSQKKMCAAGSKDMDDCIYVEKQSSKVEINLSSDDEEPKVPNVMIISEKNGIGCKVGLKKQKNRCFANHASSKKVKTVGSEDPASSEFAVKCLSDKEQPNSKESAAPAPEAITVSTNRINSTPEANVLHVGARSLPKIVGGNDLVSHQDVVLPSDRHMNEWIEPHPEEIQDNPEERGEFDSDN